MRKWLALALGLALLIVLLPSCSGAVAQPPGGSNFRLLVSDEPNDIGDFYSVNVNVSQIGVLSADTDNWTTYDVNQEFDLTKLQGDNATEVWNGFITSGNYTKVFIYVDNVTGILADNSTGAPLPGDNATVKLPGGKLQISKPFTVSTTADGSTVSFVFDITIIKAGQSGQYILKPQIAQSGADQPFNDVTMGAKGPPTGDQGNGQGKPSGEHGQSDKNVPDTTGIPQDLPNNGGQKH